MRISDWSSDVCSSDLTYLRAYDFDDSRTLESEAFLEGLKGRNYAAVRGLAYQGLRRDDHNNEFPIVAPLADYNFVSEPGVLLPGGQYNVDANLMALSRIEGRDSRRLRSEERSVGKGWCSRC